MFHLSHNIGFLAAFCYGKKPGENVEGRGSRWAEHERVAGAERWDAVLVRAPLHRLQEVPLRLEGKPGPFIILSIVILVHIDH